MFSHKSLGRPLPLLLLVLAACASHNSQKAVTIDNSTHSTSGPTTPGEETASPAPAKGEAPGSELVQGKIRNSITVPEVAIDRLSHDSEQEELNELRGIAAVVREALINSGVAVLQAPASLQPDNEQESPPDVMARIKAGDFGQAQFVLYGSVTHLDLHPELAPIPGTRTQMQSATMTLAVDYTLVDTNTFEVKDSFAASGQGRDAKLVNAGDPPFAPNRSKIILEARRSLAADVIAHLKKAGLVTKTPTTATPEGMPSLPGKVLREDLKTIRIYR